MNVEKTLANISHAAIIAALSWIAANPDAGFQWLIPALGWLGQCLTPPDIVPGRPPSG